MANNEKWGVALIGALLLILGASLVWIAWRGAAATVEGVDGLPQVRAPGLPITPEAPRVPPPPIPRPS